MNLKGNVAIMKKLLLHTGILALICSLVSFILSRWFWWIGGSVMDADTDFYTMSYRRYSIAVNSCKIFLAAGAVLLLIYVLLNRRNKGFKSDQKTDN